MLVAAVLAVGLLAGCGSARPAARATPRPEPSTLDARAVLARFTAAGLPLTNGAVQDDGTDADDMLGHKDGYSSRASFDRAGGDAGADPYSIGRGGAIVVWADSSRA